MKYLLVGILAFIAACMTVTEASAINGTVDFVVDAAGSGDFTTIQEAVDAMPDYGKTERIDILIKDGIYREKIDIGRSKHNLRFMGESYGGVCITYDDYASKLGIMGHQIGTSGTATVFVHASDVTFENIVFENAAGPVGQAVAVYVSGDRVVFRHCRFLGFQDTLYCAGPDSRQYYEDCYIEGTIDFIFGFATAAFYKCRIHSRENSFITAPATPAGHKYGFLFEDCELTADAGVDSVYLGRPWRDYGRSVFVRCRMGAHIAPQGWHNWDKPEAEKTCFFAEWGNTGPGAYLGKRVKWMRKLSHRQAREYTVAKALAGADGWDPTTDNGNGPARQK